MNTRNSFESSKRYVIACLLISAACCIVSLLVGANTPAGNYLMIIAIIFIVVCVVCAATLLKCPYCGTRIFRNCLVIKVCPHCRRDLISGQKVRNKKIK